MLIAYRLHNKMAKNILATKLGVSLGTLKNWEFGGLIQTENHGRPSCSFKDVRVIRTLQRSPLD